MRYALLMVLLLPSLAWAGGPWVVDVSSTANGIRTNTVVARPAGEAENDYVILCFKKGDDPAIDGDPTGFTQIYTFGSSTGDDQFWGMWYRKITASEANTSDTIKHTGDNDETTAGSILVRGVDGTTPFDTAWVTANHFEHTNEIHPTVPSIETNNDSSLVITFIGQGDPSSLYTEPSGHTAAWVEFAGDANDHSASAASYVLKITAGATGTQDWTSNLLAASYCYNGTIALRWDGTSRPAAGADEYEGTVIIIGMNDD